MKQYEKPMVAHVNDTGEAIYLASGDAVKTASCESVYRNGQFKKPKEWYLENDKMSDRGCEGCPAAYTNSGCNIADNNFGDPLMPKWERLGYGPDDNYLY